MRMPSECLTDWNLVQTVRNSYQQKKKWPLARERVTVMVFDHISAHTEYDMGLAATKPVFRVSDKVRFKPACSATETS